MVPRQTPGFERQRRHFRPPITTGNRTRLQGGLADGAETNPRRGGKARYEKETFEVFVEIDEAYVGGKLGKENKRFDENGNAIPCDKPKNKRGRGTKKTPAAGVKERSSKQVMFANKYKNGKSRI
jgi:hypothetical protein